MRRDQLIQHLGHYQSASGKYSFSFGGIADDEDEGTLVISHRENGLINVYNHFFSVEMNSTNVPRIRIRTVIEGKRLIPSHENEIKGGIALLLTYDEFLEYLENI